MLRCIRTARKLLEAPIGGTGNGEQPQEVAKSQLPKYVVVITATDIHNGDDDQVWLDDVEPAEDWQAMAKTFTRVRGIMASNRSEWSDIADHLCAYSHLIPLPYFH